MSELVFYGASDDLVELEGAIRKEFDASGPWRGKLIAPDGGALFLNAEFSRAGAALDWTLWVENAETYPSWLIRFGERPDREGDPAIIIDVPEGTTIEEAN
ncbi:hypothetical protein ACFWHR_07525 [Leucobacter sp. NPDC058333]|uniref:hypothetical protein n=1 Tax=Leucobacter sp. NPDC058333 TaxID=3346450 RepID=UPI00366085A9